MGRWHADRRTGNNVPFPVRARLAETFGLDINDVRVIVPPTGGGYGGKRGDEAIEAARLAMATASPVKVHWSRAEEFQFGFVRPMAVIDVRAGLGRDGSIVAMDLNNVNSGSQGMAFPYHSKSWRLHYQPAASPLAQGSYRALAATASTSPANRRSTSWPRRPGTIRSGSGSTGWPTNGWPPCCARPPGGSAGIRPARDHGPRGRRGPGEERAGRDLRRGDRRGR